MRLVSRLTLVRLPTYLLVGVGGLYLLAAVLSAVPVVSGALDDTMEVKFSRADATSGRGSRQESGAKWGTGQ